MNQIDAIRYEVGASWWAKRVSWKWAQHLSSHYFAWKVRTKWNRYTNFRRTTP